MSSKNDDLSCLTRWLRGLNEIKHVRVLGYQRRRQENKSQISLLEGEGRGIFLKEAGRWLALGVKKDERRYDEVIRFLCRCT